ncbi:MAG: DUF3857 domain-containing protein [Saprospiraceae bacterium]|nr:DUF3857 domain-containing protein [Saprospiraceae bacterium]
MKKLILVCFHLMMFSLVYSQNFEFKDYTFDDTNMEVPLSLINENEVILQKIIKKEVIVDEKNVRQFSLLHEKIIINSDKSIERNNKVYLPFRMDESVLTNKLRVILRNGKKTELSKDDIKEEINNETSIKYHYYAINGLEKGAIIEKIFILEEAPSFNGRVVGLQSNSPVVNTSFELICPSHLGFKFRSYNGLPEAKLTEKAYGDNKNAYKIEASMIEPLPTDETYANETALSKFFKYKLDSNSATGAKNLNNYREFAGAVYENLHPETDKKADEVILKYIKEIPLSKDLTEQIRNIENKIKTTVSHNRYFDENKSFVEAVKSKQANELDMLRLYTAVFKKLNIGYQTVLTSKRFETYFDKDFETLEQVDEVLFYFPDINKYLEPVSAEYRIPLFNFNYGANYGLFIREREFGGAKMGVGEVKMIEIPDGNTTHDFTDIVIDFTKDTENPEVHTIHKYQGYSATSYQVIKDFVPDDRYKEIVDDIANNFTQEAEKISIKTSNDGIQHLGKDPFIIDVRFHGKDLLQKAGDNLLFNVGVLIGRQMEMYQAEKRVLPVEMYFPHFYTRNITIKLPDGYKIANPEVFNIEHYVKVDGQDAGGWRSSAKQTDKTLEVTNHEYYKSMQFPLTVFEDYKKVVNAAADFNKIVVVLEKK